MAAWKARRGSPKVGRNETFTAKFQHLYTSLTWRFLGWTSRALSVVSFCREQAELADNDHRDKRFTIGFHGRGPWRALLQNLARQSRCELRAMEPAVCGIFRYPYPSRSEGAAHLYLLLRSICAMIGSFSRHWP